MIKCKKEEKIIKKIRKERIKDKGGSKNKEKRKSKEKQGEMKEENIVTGDKSGKRTANKGKIKNLLTNQRVVDIMKTEIVIINADNKNGYKKVVKVMKQNIKKLKNMVIILAKLMVSKRGTIL